MKPIKSVLLLVAALAFIPFSASAETAVPESSEVLYFMQGVIPVPESQHESAEVCSPPPFTWEYGGETAPTPTGFGAQFAESVVPKRKHLNDRTEIALVFNGQRFVAAPHGDLLKVTVPKGVASEISDWAIDEMNSIHVWRPLFSGRSFTYDFTARTVMLDIGLEFTTEGDDGVAITLHRFTDGEDFSALGGVTDFTVTETYDGVERVFRGQYLGSHVPKKEALFVIDQVYVSDVANGFVLKDAGNRKGWPL